MESGAAEAVADGARRQGELWAPVKVEKGRIEFGWHFMIFFKPIPLWTLKAFNRFRIPPFSCRRFFFLSWRQLLELGKPFSICVVFIFIAKKKQREGGKKSLMCSICWTHSKKSCFGCRCQSESNFENFSNFDYLTEAYSGEEEGNFPPDTINHSST